MKLMKWTSILKVRLNGEVAVYFFTDTVGAAILSEQ